MTLMSERENMNSKILDQLFGNNFDISYLIISVFVILIIVIIILVSFINKYKLLASKYSVFMQGSKAKSLESQIAEIIIVNKELIELSEKNKKNIRELFAKNKICYQKIGLEKYDAFSEMGGKLSFALTLLDEDNNGILFNSVYGREGGYSYIRDIKGGQSDIELGEYEQKSLEIAMK